MATGPCLCDGLLQVMRHLAGQRGRKPKPQLWPPANLLAAQVVKHRLGGRGVQVTPKTILGSEAAIQARLAASTPSQTINTSFVERNNLTCRQGTRVRQRPDLQGATFMVEFELLHFVLPQASLAQP